MRSSTLRLSEKEEDREGRERRKNEDNTVKGYEKRGENEGVSEWGRKG